MVQYHLRTNVGESDRFDQDSNLPSATLQKTTLREWFINSATSPSSLLSGLIMTDQFNLACLDMRAPLRPEPAARGVTRALRAADDCLQLLRAKAWGAAELGGSEPVIACKSVAREGGRRRFSLSCRPSGSPTASPKRFSSSSLPPSFAPGRCTTVFTARGTAGRGAPSFSGGAAR